jgi:hypothetical protein
MLLPKPIGIPKDGPVFLSCRSGSVSSGPWGTHPLASDLPWRREEMQANIRDAVVAHQGRVAKSHNGMAPIAVPIALMVLLAIGSCCFFHRGSGGMPLHRPSCDAPCPTTVSIKLVPP